MNAFTCVLQKHSIDRAILKRGRLTTLQINMGNLCNQRCLHCHSDASPDGDALMPKKVVDDILRFLKSYPIETLDLTGGAPELNPHFDYCVDSARPLVHELIVRSNLTVLFEKGKEYLPEFFKSHRVHLICSLPCYTQDNVDRQRGKGVFEKSIKALGALNRVGYAKHQDLRLDLVYNPSGACLPGVQDSLERDYRKVLKEQFNIEFNRLLTITNVAIKRFKIHLQTHGDYDKYAQILENNFNPETLTSLMCRSFLSVGPDGRLYDCDFNCALGYAISDVCGAHLTIDQLQLEDLTGREIMTGEHCLSCTAGRGSSCQGALIDAS